MTISLRLNDADTNLFKKYAELNGMTMSELIRESVISRIENEYDLKAISEYEAEKEKGTLELFDFDEVIKELDLWKNMLFFFLKEQKKN